MPTDDQIPQSDVAPNLSRRTLLRRGLLLAGGLPFVGLLAACGRETPTTSSNTLMPLVVKATAQPANVTPSATATAAPTARPTLTATATATVTASATQTPAATRFAVIGDFGINSAAEAAVASLVASWNVEFVLTTGDNNYPSGSAATIDTNVGQFYHSFMYPYNGSYGAGADRQRFFPVLGNHDWLSDSAQPALDFFAMPGRYYSFIWGPAQFFALDSDPNEPDGVSADSKQAQWLRKQLASSAARWKIAAFHHPPFSSGLHGPSAWMQWPFEEWGVDAVLNGHDHSYERIQQGNLLYFVNGLGGGSRYAAGGSPAKGSQIFYNANHGAMLVTMDQQQISFQFISVAGEVIDQFSLT